MDALAGADIVLFDRFSLDRRRGALFRRGEDGLLVPVTIGSRALDLLGVLIERQGDLVSRDQIMDAVWPGTAVEGANVTMQIAALRRVLDDGQSTGSLIQTIPGRGYRLAAPVTLREADTGFGASAVGWHRADEIQDARTSESVAPVPTHGSGKQQSAPDRRRLGRRVTAILVALAVAGSVAAWTLDYHWSGSASAPRLSMVVLPFTNLGNDPDQEYFVDAITNDLTTDLSRLSGGFVIARGTAFTYKGKPVDMKQIGRELSVRYVVEGSVRRAGEQVLVNVELVDAESGAHLWADRFETDRRNLVEAQSEITGRLAKTLNAELMEAVGRRIERERAADPDARDLWMRAWARFLRPPLSAETMQEALRLDELALEKDPESVDARIGIAAILITDLIQGWSSSVEQDEARTELLLHDALERDPKSGAHLSMGILRRFQNRLIEARIELETAIALDRNNTWAFRHLGMTLMQLGQPEAAITYIEKSIRLSPNDTFVRVNHDWLGQSHLLLGHLDQAVDFLRKACAADPRFAPRLWLAGALGLRGDLDEARIEIAEAIKLKPEINSLARLRASLPSTVNPQYLALREKTLNVGLRRAGMPEE